MTVLAHDRPAAVAGMVAAESAWVPEWRRVASGALLLALPGVAAVGRLPAAAAAAVAVGMALGCRLLPALTARRLLRQDRPREGSRRHAGGGDVSRGRGAGTVHLVRVERQRLLVLQAGMAVIAAGAVAASGADLVALGVGICAATLVVLQHRPALRDPVLAVSAEVLESLALLGILPLLAMATRGWWQ